LLVGFGGFLLVGALLLQLERSADQLAQNGEVDRLGDEIKGTGL
jgi:hypothetical protein